MQSQHLPDFGITGHFILRVVNIHCILNDCTILIDFNLLCHPSNGKVVTVSVKLNTREKKKAQIENHATQDMHLAAGYLTIWTFSLAELMIMILLKSAVSKDPIQSTLERSGKQFSCSQAPSSNPLQVHIHFDLQINFCSGALEVFTVQLHQPHYTAPEHQSWQLTLETCLKFSCMVFENKMLWDNCQLISFGCIAPSLSSCIQQLSEL